MTKPVVKFLEYTYTFLINTYTGTLELKTKLTVTIDEDLVPLAKQYARARGVSLSQLIETALRQIDSDKRSSFSKRWRGKFRVVSRGDARFRALEKKYL